MDKEALQSIPGVGRSIAKDLTAIGVRSVSGLKGRDPQDLYERSNKRAGKKQDRCLLYVFRCAVYFAETSRPDSRKLKWWYWKDRTCSRGHKYVGSRCGACWRGNRPGDSV